MRIPKPREMQASVFRFFPQDRAKQYERHWQEQWWWAKQFSNYFPKRYKKIISECDWHKENWKTIFENAVRHRHTEKNKAFLTAIAEGDLTRLRQIVEQEKDKQTRLKELIDYNFLWEEDFLSPDRSNDSVELREIIWDLICHRIEKIELIPLWALATYQPEAKIIKLLENRANINQDRCWKGVSVFYAACARGYVKTAQLALTRGAAINEEAQGKTALHAACESGHVDTVKFLLNLGNANLNATDEGEELTPLPYASHFGLLEIAQLLLAHNPEIDARSDWGWTALHAASSNGHTEVVKLLLNHHARIDALNEDGNTSLAEACKSGKTETVRLLLEQGANVNGFVENNVNAERNNGWSSPLSLACSNGDTKIATLLLERGADINGNHADKMPPLNAACSFGDPQLVELLLKRGAKDNHAYHSLHLICGSEEPNLEIATLLIEHDANLSSHDKEGFTPLTRACWGGNLEIVELLLDSEANVNEVDGLGSTPLAHACALNRPEIAELLVDREANIFSDAVWTRTSQGAYAKTVVLEKIFEKMAFEDHPESKAFHEKLIEKFHSDLVSICASRSDLLLLAAITTAQALEKISTMLSVEPKILDEEYRETLCALANRFHPEVLDLLLPEEDGAGYDSLAKRPRSP